MALSTRITARQTQQLTMTPQLRQAIELLQMSSGELQRFIDEEVEKNPLLETEKPEADETVKAPDVPLDRPEPQSGLSGGDPDRQGNATDLLVREITLRDTLLSQISLSELEPDIFAIVCLLVDELDDDGYLRTPLVDIGTRIGASPEQMEESLLFLQSCEPTGIAARDLGECFALQLEEKGVLDAPLKLFLEHISEIPGQPIGSFWKDLGIDAEDYSALLTTIKALNPAPGAAFDTGFVQYAIPDVSVTRNNLGGWSVELNNSVLPAIIVNNDLAREVSQSGSEAAKYVVECSRRADWLLKSIEQRSSTILKVAAEIVRVQEEFFSLGVSKMRPLTMRDVAEAVGVNESTVSRVTNSKYLSCERGTFELRFFFSKGIRRSDGGADMSSASIQESIRKLIEEESALKILSDDKIVKILKESGVDIARRTVSKYREGMKIPSSVERRRFKSNLDKIR